MADENVEIQRGSEDVRATSPQPGTSGIQTRRSCSPLRDTSNKRKRSRHSPSSDTDATVLVTKTKTGPPRRQYDEVSVGSLSDSISIADSHESEVSSNDGVHMAANVASMHAADGVDDFIHEQYLEEPLRAFLPPVSEKLAETITHWCCQVPDREKIRNMFKTTLVPENIAGLGSVKINQVLYQQLPYRVKLNDQRLRGINSFVTRGLGPVVSVLDLLLKLEKMLMNKAHCHIEEGKIIVNRDSMDLRTTTTENVIFDVKKVRLLIDQGVRALTICNSVCLQKRKTGLKGSLDRKYHYLTKPSNKVTDELLGSNLEQQISDCNKILSAARKISFTPNRNYNRRGRSNFQYTTHYSTNNRRNSGQSYNQVRKQDSFRGRSNFRGRNKGGYSRRTNRFQGRRGSRS